MLASLIYSPVDALKQNLKYMKAFAVLNIQIMCIRQICCRTKSLRCTCMDTLNMARGFCTGSSPTVVNFHQEAHKGTSEMMSSKTSKFFFHHQLHVRIHHTRCVWLCLRALHRAEPLQSKMTALGRTALRSKTLESKLTSSLNTQPSVARCM